MPNELLEVPIDQVRLNPVALRDVNRESEKFRQLVDSIKSEGVLSAVTMRRVNANEVSEDGKQYILIDGLQRYTASNEANLKTIPAIIKDRSDAESLVTQIIGNVHRIETKPVEYSRAIIRILGYYPTMTEAELATKLSQSPGWIQKILGLNRLEDAIKPLVDDGKINVGNAFSLSKLPPAEQSEWIERAMTVGTAEFTPMVNERLKQIREANRKGEDAPPEEFVPITTLRSKKELETEMATPTMGPALIQDSDILQSSKDKKEAAIKAFELGIKWALNFDARSIQTQRDRDAERRKKRDEDRIRRESEKQEKRAKEAEEAANRARLASQAAKEKAAALGQTPELATTSVV